MKFYVILFGLVVALSAFAKNTGKSKVPVEPAPVHCGEEMATSIAYSIHLALHKTPGDFIKVGSKSASAWWVNLSDERYEFTMKKDDSDYTCVPSNLTVTKVAE
jgi:hypothetical protein